MIPTKKLATLLGVVALVIVGLIITITFVAIKPNADKTTGEIATTALKRRKSVHLMISTRARKI